MIKTSTKKGYRWFLRDANNKLISPLHDLPHGFTEENGKLYVNMVVEIPRNTKRKMEITTDEKYNPIKQDTKKNKLRFVAERKNRPTKKQNSKIHSVLNSIWKEDEGYNLFSYGAVPQTFENPKKNLAEYHADFFYADLLNIKPSEESILDKDNKVIKLKDYLEEAQIIKGNKLEAENIYGDGDPLDIFLAHPPNVKFKIGSFLKVEVLGIIPMIDDGEIDWKVFAKLPEDKKNYNKNIKTYIRWFKYYKGVYDKDAQMYNRQNIIFGNNEAMMSKEVAKIVIETCILK